MSRLTQKDEQGNWCVRGLGWEQLHVGRVITQNVWEKLYGALWKLMEYEDTGLTPERIEEINDFEKTQTAHCLVALQEEQRKHRWIPVVEQLPKPGTKVLAQWEKTIRQTNSVHTYLDILELDTMGRWCGDYGMPVGRIIAWMPLPEPYRPEVLREAGKEAGQDAAAPLLQSAT